MARAADPRVAIQASLERASNYNRWIADQARAQVGARVLDAGWGSGKITRLLQDRELVVAVDVWEDFVGMMGDVFAEASNVAVHRFASPIPPCPPSWRYELDSAICVNVPEHMEDDQAALSNIAAALRPGGAIFLLVPAWPEIVDHPGGHAGNDRVRRDRPSDDWLATMNALLPMSAMTVHFVVMVASSSIGVAALCSRCAQAGSGALEARRR